MRKLSCAERISFLRSTTVYMRSGMPLTNALALYAGSIERSSSEMITSIGNAIAEGRPLSAALSDHPRSFGPVEIGVLRAGEATGALPEHLEYLAALLERRARLSASLRSALIYPMIVFFGTTAISGFIILYALPRILPIFAGFHERLPFSTRLLLHAYALVHDHFLLLLLAAIAAAFACRQASRWPRVRRALERAALRAPIARNITKNYYAGVLCRLLGGLIRRGMRLPAAIDLARSTVRFEAYRASLTSLDTHILSGSPASTYLRTRPDLYPAEMAALAELGEATGTLATCLESAADLFEERLAKTLKAASSSLEPALLACAGIVVGFVALSILSPIYTLTQGISA